MVSSGFVILVCVLALTTFSNKVAAIPDDIYEPDDVYTLASQLLLDVPQTHNISDLGNDIDWVYFTLSSPLSVRIETSGSSGDTRMYLYNSSGVPNNYLAYNDDGGPGLFSRITMYSLPPDIYYVRITEYGSNNEIANYQISLVQYGAVDDSYEPDDIYTQASEIQSGVPQTHSINDGGSDVDWVRFTLQVKSNITVETSGTSGDTIIYLYNSTGVPNTYIRYNDDSGPGAFSRITYNNLEKGTYYVRVREYGSNNEIANYTISLSVTPLESALNIALILAILAIIVIVAVVVSIILYMSWKRGRQQVPQPYGMPAYPGTMQAPPGTTMPATGTQPPVYQPIQQPQTSPQPMLCLRCGKPIETTWSACKYCGNRLTP